MKARTLTEERGFTLVETMVAALIIVLVLSALVVLFSTGQSQASADVEQAQLINLADQQIEQLRGLASSGTNGFDALALSATPTVQSTSVVQNTFRDPTQFVFNSTPACLEIDNSYDNLSSTSVRPFGAQPANFTQWANCSTYGEPLEVIPGSALVTELSSDSQACALNSTPQPSTVYSPCRATLNGAQFDVYTFVTDTYAGCGSGAALIGGTITVQTTVPAYACPTVTNGVVSISGCGASSSTSTFSTSSTASSPCADARRITVAVVPVAGQVHSTLARLTPVYLSTVITNPVPTSSTESGSVGLTLQAGL